MQWKLVTISTELNLKSLNRISNELDDLLLPYYFDLSIFSQIENEDLIDHIQRVGVIIYQVKKTLAMELVTILVETC